MNTAERTTRALGGRWHTNYGIAFCPAHANTRTPALSLKDGEAGRLLIRCHAGCGFIAVINALRARGMVEDANTNVLCSTPNWSRMIKRTEAENPKREAQVRALWDETCHILGTPGERYLRTRGITCDLPATLRFHPACWHGPSAGRLPAMIALVEGSNRPAIHRTYLMSDGRGKAAVHPQKMMLGPTTGGAVRLVRTGGHLLVAEGIETALALASGLLCRPASIWAALSTSGIAGLCLPDVPRRLTIATDGDAPGRSAGQKLAERAAMLGWRVSILPAADGCDWNDVLVMKGSAA